MSSVCRALAAIAIAYVALKGCATATSASSANDARATPAVGSPVAQPFGAPRRVLRVCSDPNNMPFSNSRREGFENKVADLVARDLGRRVEYFWAPQRRGFVRNTLAAQHCDVIMGVPARYELARPTRPYYRSGYVFVSRRDRRLDIRSLDDPRLR